MRDVTVGKRHQRRHNQFLLTHPVRDVTGTDSEYVAEVKISTHTPREGCDLSMRLNKPFAFNFYSHTP